jgi:malonyl-CoA/methylmalonyl-CoA synthetase
VFLDTLERSRQSSRSSVVDVDTSESAPLDALLASSQRLASSFSEGERVALMMHPGRAWLEVFLAVAWAGAAAVPLPLAASSAERAHYLREAEVERIVVDEAHGPTLRAEPSAVAVVLDEDLRSAAIGGPLPRVRHDAPALVLFTSGTTGKPKAALLTHANLEAQTRALRDAWRVDAGDVLATSLPLHHLHGIVVALLTTISAGGSVRLHRRFDARQLLVDLEHSTVFMSVPTMLQRLVDAMDREPALAAGPRAQRLVTSGSAALPAALAQRWASRAGSIPLERYGMTEIGIALSNPLAPTERVLGSVGVELVGVETRVVGDDGSPAPTGELLVRGPSVFAGYGRPGRAVMAAVDAEGFLHTGDVVRRDDAGRFFILGRASSDILKTGGEKVSALEIEEALREHPDVIDAAVIGVPDELWGDRVVAFVVPTSAAVVPESVQAFARERLAPYKRPKELHLVAELPRNAMGKVLKQELVRLL